MKLLSRTLPGVLDEVLAEFDSAEGVWQWFRDYCPKCRFWLALAAVGHG